METVKKAGLAAAVMLLTCSGAYAGDTEWDDMFAPYVQRIDKATTSSGDFNDVNAATQTITPWPPYVHNRHIPGNTRQMIDTTKQHKELQKELQELRSLRGTAGGASATPGQSSFGAQPKQQSGN